MNDSQDSNESGHRNAFRSIGHLWDRVLRVIRSRLVYWAALSGIIIPASLLIIFIVVWLAGRDPLPSRIQVATARPGQSYHVFGNDFCDALNVKLGATAALIEAIAGTKELVFALGAAVFLIWRVSKRKREKRQEAMLVSDRKHLNQLVDQALAIEQSQLNVTDPIRLQEMLNEVTQLKLQGLNELTDNEVRGDRLFSIFLLQCANLIDKIQFSMMDCKSADHNVRHSQQAERT